MTTSDNNKFTNDILDPKINNKKSVNKSNISAFISYTDLNETNKQIANKELKAEHDKIVRM